jgi:hypothetical protein
MTNKTIKELHIEQQDITMEMLKITQLRKSLNKELANPMTTELNKQFIKIYKKQTRVRADQLAEQYHQLMVELRNYDSH